MNKSLPLGPVDAGVVAQRVAARHRWDDQKLADPPGPDQLLALARFILDRFTRLSEADSHAELQDGLLVTRLLRRETDRVELQLLRAGLRAGMTASQLGQPLGIRSRQGVYDRVKALVDKVEAEAMHVPVDALRDAPRPVTTDSQRLRQVAAELVASWDALLTDPEDSWMEGIAIILRSPQGTSKEDNSLAAQIREVLDEIDQNAALSGRPPAATPSARRALQAARDLGLGAEG